MSEYNKEWERTKAYLIRSLFHSVPNTVTALSPISEESTQTSNFTYQRSSTDNSYFPSEESLDTELSLTIPVSKPAATHNKVSPERDRSPLPPLIIEREPNKHDEPEEYYDKLLLRMKKICKMLYLEGRSLSDDDFFVDSEGDINGDTYISAGEKNNNYNVYSEPFNIEEEINNTRHESNDNNDSNENQTNISIDKIYNSKSDSVIEDIQDELSTKDTTYTDPENLQISPNNKNGVLNVENNIANPRNRSTASNTKLNQDNTSLHNQRLSTEVPSSSSLVLLRDSTSSNSQIKETFEQIEHECSIPPDEIAVLQSPQQLSFAQTYESRERSQSPILICPYVPIKRMKKNKRSPTHQDSKDSNSPQFRQITVEAMVHVDADFHCQDTMLIEFNTEPQVNVDSQLVQHTSPEVQPNPTTVLPRASTESLLFNETPQHRLKQNLGLATLQHDKDLIFVQTLTESDATQLTCEVTTEVSLLSTTKSNNIEDAVILEESQDSNTISSRKRKYQRCTTDEIIEEMRSSQPHVSIESISRIDKSDIAREKDLNFVHSSPVLALEVTNVKWEDINIDSANENSIATNWDSDNPRGRKREYEINSGQSKRMDCSDSSSSNDLDPDEPAFHQLTVDAMVHVDAELRSQNTMLIGSDKETQNEAVSTFVQNLQTDSLLNPVEILHSNFTPSTFDKRTHEPPLTRACGMSPDQIETVRSTSKERSRSPILVCHHITPACMGKSKNTEEHRSTNDSASPQITQMTVSAMVHVNADFNNQDKTSAIIRELQNDTLPPSPIFKKTFHQSLPCSSRIASIQFEADHQGNMSDRKYDQSPILECKHHQNPKKQASDSIAYQNNEDHHNPQFSSTVVRAVVHANTEPETPTRLRVLPRDKTPTSLLSVTLSRQTSTTTMQATGTKDINQSPIIICHHKPHNRCKQTVHSVVQHETQDFFPESLSESVVVNSARDDVMSESEGDITVRSMSSSECSPAEDAVFQQCDQASDKSSSSQDQVFASDEHVEIESDGTLSSSSSNDNGAKYIEEMRSGQSHMSIESIRIDEARASNGMDITFVCNKPMMMQDITNITSHSQEKFNYKLIKATDNSEHSDHLNNNPRGRKRRHDTISCHDKKIDWDALGNLFVGEPKLFKLCSHKHY